MPNARLSVAKAFSTSVVKQLCANTNENLKHNSILSDQHVLTQFEIYQSSGKSLPQSRNLIKELNQILVLSIHDSNPTNCIDKIHGYLREKE